MLSPDDTAAGDEQRSAGETCGRAASFAGPGSPDAVGCTGRGAPADSQRLQPRPPSGDHRHPRRPLDTGLVLDRPLPARDAQGSRGPRCFRLGRGPQRHDLPHRARARAADRRSRERQPRAAPDAAGRPRDLHRLGAGLPCRTVRGGAGGRSFRAGGSGRVRPGDPQCDGHRLRPRARGGPALLLDRDHRGRGAAGGIADRRPDAPPDGLARTVRRAHRDQRRSPSCASPSGCPRACRGRTA